MKNLILGILLGFTLAVGSAYAVIQATEFGTRFGGDPKDGYPQIVVPRPGLEIVPALPLGGRPC